MITKKYRHWQKEVIILEKVNEVKKNFFRMILTVKIFKKMAFNR